jgi:hypothetical protein
MRARTRLRADARWYYSRQSSEVERLSPKHPTKRNGSSEWPFRHRTQSGCAAPCCHALHDGYTDQLYALLPTWQAEFGLSYAGLALIRALYYATMGGLQLPGNRPISEVSPRAALALATLIAAAGFTLIAFPSGFTGLCVGLVLRVLDPVSSIRARLSSLPAPSARAVVLVMKTRDSGSLVELSSCAVEQTAFISRMPRAISYLPAPRQPPDTTTPLVAGRGTTDAGCRESLRTHESPHGCITAAVDRWRRRCAGLPGRQTARWIYERIQVPLRPAVEAAGSQLARATTSLTHQ